MKFTEPKWGPKEDEDIPKGAVILCPGCDRHLFLTARKTECWDAIDQNSWEAMGNSKVPGPWEDIVCSFCGEDLLNEMGEVKYIERCTEKETDG
jgi:hypothetical protein